MIIKWTNKFSHETGFVKAVNHKNKHFENTFKSCDAHSYKNRDAALRIIKTLASYGEAENNDFEVVDA